MGKFFSVAIIAVAVFTFLNCHKNEKKTENIAKLVAKEYTISTGNLKTQKLTLVETGANTVQFSVDSLQVDSLTAVTFRNAGPVKLTRLAEKDGGGIALSGTFSVVATIYSSQASSPVIEASIINPETKATTSLEKTLGVTVVGAVVDKQVAIDLAIADLQADPLMIKLIGESK